MKKLIIKLVYFLPSIIILLTALIISPFKNIKFCRADMSRLGGITFLDWYLSLRKLKNQKSEIIICFYDSTINHINLYWFKIWKKKVFLVKNQNFFNVLQFLIFKFKINKKLLIDDKFLNQKNFVKNTSSERLKYLTKLYDNYIKDYKPNIEIPKSDREKENFLLRNLNLKKLKYVCFHNRDEREHIVTQLKNWSHHSFKILILKIMLMPQVILMIKI